MLKMGENFRNFDKKRLKFHKFQHSTLKVTKEIDLKMAVKGVNCHLSVKFKNLMTINPQISNLKRNYLDKMELKIVKWSHLDLKMAVKEVNCHLSVKFKNLMTINPQISNLKRNPKMVTIKMVKMIKFSDFQHSPLFCDKN